MKDIKQTPSWPQVAVARRAWMTAPPAKKAAASAAYAQAVKQCLKECGASVMDAGPSRRLQ